MPPRMRLHITDPFKWGCLVKTWATGRSYMPDGSSFPLPRSRAELDAQMKQAGAGSVPDEIKCVQFIVPQDHPSLLVMLLPAKEAIEAVDAEVEQHQKNAAAGQSEVYPLPAFYQTEAWSGQPPTVTDWDRFATQRIGEYTILECQ